MDNKEKFNLSQLYQARAKDFRNKDEKKQELDRIIKKARKIFHDSGEKLDEEDEKKIFSEPAKKPIFPLLITGIALTKDLLDIPLEMTIIGVVLTTMFSLMLSVILFLWVLGKLKGGWWKKKIIRWLWLRYVAVIIIEFVPIFKIVPATTIFILMAHHREKKIVKLANLALEEMRGAGALKYIK